MQHLRVEMGVEEVLGGHPKVLSNDQRSRKFDDGAVLCKSSRQRKRCLPRYRVSCVGPICAGTDQAKRTCSIPTPMMAAISELDVHSTSKVAQKRSTHQLLVSVFQRPFRHFDELVRRPQVVAKDAAPVGRRQRDALSCPPALQPPL